MDPIAHFDHAAFSQNMLDTVPDEKATIENFLADVAARSGPYTNAAYEMLGNNELDVEQFFSPAACAFHTGTCRHIAAHLRQTARLICCGREEAVEAVGFHLRFGWTLASASGAKAFLGKADIHEKVRISIGDRSYISGPADIHGHHGLMIGSFSSIGSNFSANSFRDLHPTEYVSTFNFRENRRLLADGLGLNIDFDFLEAEQESQNNNIAIGSDVWLGKNVSVAPGVTIGHGVVVGRDSLVLSDCEPYGIYVGKPARLVRFRFEPEVVDALIQIRWWDWPMRKILANKEFFSLKPDQHASSLASVIVESEGL